MSRGNQKKIKVALSLHEQQLEQQLQTFEDVQEIKRELSEIKKLLLAEKKSEPEKPMSFRELCDYIGYKPRTVYSKIESIPHSRVGKRYFFFRPSIDEWLMKSCKTKNLNKE